jgi:hypothetical protein
MYARTNGVLPTQPKILARIHKALKNVEPEGYTEITIPWSDFVFSNKEPWPPSFQQGLNSFLAYLDESQDDYFDEASDEKIYKWSPKFNNDFFYPQSEKEFAKREQYVESLPLLSEKDILIRVQRYVRDPAKENVLGTFYYSAVQGRFLPVCRLLSVNESLSRLADKTGVKITVKLRAIDWEISSGNAIIASIEESRFLIILPYRSKFNVRDNSLEHEVMHLTQYVGKHLLTARDMPSAAFTPCYAAYRPKIPTAAYTGKPKSSFTTDLGTYEEDPLEFYPNAYSRAREALQELVDYPIPFVMALCFNYMNWYLSLKSIKNRQAIFHMLYSAFAYVDIEPTSEDLQYLRDFIYGKTNVWGDLIALKGPDFHMVFEYTLLYLKTCIKRGFFTYEQAPQVAKQVISQAAKKCDEIYGTVLGYEPLDQEKLLLALSKLGIGEI